MPEEDLKSVDTEVFGKWGSRLRNMCGVLAVLTTCITSLIYVWTIHESISNNGGWPDRISLAIMTLGPCFIGWAFMNVNKVLRVILDPETKRKLKDRVKDGVEAFNGEGK